MKHIVLLISFLLYHTLITAQPSYAEIKYETIEENNSTKIKFDNMGLLTNCNPDFIKRLIFYSNKYDDLIAAKPIDTVYCSPYGYNIKILKSKSFNDYVIIFEAIDEYDSDIRLYFISNGFIYKICDLPIQTNCSNCDAWNYPIDKIVINGDDKFIKINFLQPLNYKISKKDWQLYQPDKIEMKFDKINKKMNNWR